MESIRGYEWETGDEAYSPSQVEAVLDECSIEVASESSTDFLGFCPFHFNDNSPAFAINKYNGKWICFNPTCQQSGSLPVLLRRIKKMSVLQAEIFIAKHKDSGGLSTYERVQAAMAKPVDFKEWPVEQVVQFRQEFWEDPAAKAYMRGRKFEDETLEYFDIGLSHPNSKRPYPLITVPMHDPKGMLVGFVGRGVEEKRFKNSPNLPTSKTLWNFHRAKKCGDTVIVVEASFDAMRVHQAGYPNVVATLHGHLSAHQAEQLGRTFSTIIIMTDYDKLIYRPNCKPCGYRPCEGHRPGRDLGRQIIKDVPNKRYLWAAYDDHCVFPHGAKDPGEISDDEIRTCLTNSVSNLTYSLWDIEKVS